MVYADVKHSVYLLAPTLLAKISEVHKHKLIGLVFSYHHYDLDLVIDDNKTIFWQDSLACWKRIISLNDIVKTVILCLYNPSL